MSKLILSLGAIVALTAIFVIPTNVSTTHVARASTCSASTSGLTSSSTTSGGCSSGGAVRQPVGQGPQIVAETVAHGGSIAFKSSCTSISTSSAQKSIDTNTGDSNGAVSCSSHSP